MPKVKNMYAVILAGGSGERFWPMSTSKRPKQFLAIPSGKPLICAAVERIEKLIPRKRIFIITRADLVGLVRRALPDFPVAGIIGEPCGRDTAAAIALGAGLVKSRNPRGAFCVLTSDHVIEKRGVFLETLKDSFATALSSDYMVTIGIKPAFPSTGFGYIETAQKLGPAGRTGFFKVKGFVEKPDLPTAQKYLKTGRFYWNSGMFIWSVPVLEAALAKYRPQLLPLIRAVGNAAGRKSFGRTLRDEYAKLEKISIDYAVMEKADNILMAKCGFAWDDVGSWLALENHCRKNKDGNIFLGRGETLAANGNIAVAEDGLIALVGVRDLVVVRSGAVTLVCAKDRVQEIKRLVARMKQNGAYKDVI